MRVPNLHPSSQVIRYRKFFRRLSHASSFSELVPSLSQSRFTIKRGKSLYFRLGRSRHSRNFLVHPSIARVRIQSAHSERKKRSSCGRPRRLNQNVYQLIPIHSVKVSTAFSRPSTERCTMLIGIGKDPLSCTRPRGQHSWQSSVLSFEDMVWLCSWCSLIDVECRFSLSENLHLL